MNTWFRKEDWWIVVIVIVMAFFGFIFWCVSNTHPSASQIDCEAKGGSYIYLKYSGYRCLKEVK